MGLRLVNLYCALFSTVFLGKINVLFLVLLLLNLSALLHLSNSNSSC